jgi:hypothetical protein
MSYFNAVTIADGANLDAFSRVRTSDPAVLFTEQSQFNLGTIQMEAGNTGTGVLPAHDANTRMTKLSATAGAGTSFLQSFAYIPYQPGRSQFIAMTGVVGAAVAGAVVDMGYFDAANGIIFRQNSTTNLQFVLRTSTSGAPSDANVVAQSAWNVDKLDGTGASGKTLDITKALILVIDLQFLGMGRVRIGFDIDGKIYYAHQFLNANNLSVPYMQTASLPVGMLITAAATGSTKDAYFKCVGVSSEGGNLDLFGFMFSTPEVTVTAGNGARTPILAIRPKTTYNALTNRQYFELQNLAIIVTGAVPIYWELVVGGTYAAQAWTDVNTTFSGIEYSSTPGTFTNLTGGAVILSGYSSGAGGGTSPPTVTPVNLPALLSRKFPLSLDRAGAVRSLGTYTLLVQGIGATSATRASMNFKEVR